MESERLTSTGSNFSIDPVFMINLERIALSIIPALLTFCTVLGNTFVITAVFINSRISRRNTSVLVLNLAVADLLVGSIVMPLGVLQILTGGVWTLSRFTCKVWTSLDVICCTASIVTLCVISVERFIGVTRPLKYSIVVTRRRLICSVVLVWLYSFTVLLATVRWNDDFDSPIQTCNVGGELEFVMQSVTFSFIVPLLVILIVYHKIYKVIRQRESNLQTATINLNIVQRKSLFNRQASLKSSESAGKLNLLTPLRMHYGGGNGNVVDTTKQRNFFQKQMKTAKTLGIVVGAFVLCWLPFFILYLISK